VKEGDDKIRKIDKKSTGDNKSAGTNKDWNYNSGEGILSEYQKT
jgi:hypothetical protein